MFNDNSTKLCWKCSNLSPDLDAVSVRRSTYSSALTKNSDTYSRDNCRASDYFYEAVEVRTNVSAEYTFASNSMIDTYGYLYNQSFHPSNPSVHLLLHNDDDCQNKQFRLIARLEADAKYVLVVTTHTPGMLGPFSIVATGPVQIKFDPSRTSRCLIQFVEWACTFVVLARRFSGCFSGDQCQYHGKGIGLNLDDLLRYEIQHNQSFFQQSTSMKVIAAIVILMFVIGVINSLLSFITFYTAESREVGCGIYLLVSSIISLITMIMFTVKFWFLLLTQTNSDTNPSIRHAYCRFNEPLLKLFLYLNTWFHACVAAERAIMVYKGVHFNKTHSRCAAWQITLLLPIFVAGSTLHEIFYRRLMTSKEHQYSRCVVNYPSEVQHYNTIILFLHFLVPFAANLLSALFIVFATANRRSASHIQSTYREQLYAQFIEHKQLLISPLILVILSLPRLIISLLSGCIEISRNSSWYLLGYFISFIPSLSSFIVFVMPSHLYRTQFKNSAKVCRRWLLHRR